MLKGKRKNKSLERDNTVIKNVSREAHCFGILWKCDESCCPLWARLDESCYARSAYSVGQAYFINPHLGAALTQKKYYCVFKAFDPKPWPVGMRGGIPWSCTLGSPVQPESAAELGFCCLPASLRHFLSSCLLVLCCFCRSLSPCFPGPPVHWKQFPCPLASREHWALLRVTCVGLRWSVHSRGMTDGHTSPVSTRNNTIVGDSLKFCTWWKISLRDWQGAGWTPGAANA